MMFKNIAEAYDCLSDARKRQIYDQYGRDGLNGGDFDGAFFDGRDAFTVFKNFFGDDDPFSHFEDLFTNMGPNQGSGRDTGMGGFSTVFDNHSFFQGAGSGGGSRFQFSTSSKQGGGMTGSSTSTTTKKVNGKTIVVTETTVRKPDGTTETTRSESGDGASGGAAAGMLSYIFGNSRNSHKSNRASFGNLGMLIVGS